MTRQVRDVMTAGVAAVEPMTPLATAAKLMRENDIGEVLVAYDCDLFGVLTDRDIVVRAVAAGLDPREVTAGKACSPPPVVALAPDDTTDRAAALMREHAVRRLPVVEHGGCPVGMVGIGDLAVIDEPQSPLAGITGATPNR